MTEMVFAALQEAFGNFLRSVAAFLPRALITVSIVLAGWLIATICRRATRYLLTRMGFGRLCDRQGVTELLRSADLPPAEALAASAVFWLVWVGFMLSGVDVLGFAALQGLLSEFALFVPRLLVAVVILVVGFVLANVAWRATLLAAVNARCPHPGC
jgi:hypothetical protein